MTLRDRSRTARATTTAVFAALMLRASASCHGDDATANAPRLNLPAPSSSGPIPAGVGSYADVVGRVAPAVVTIRSERVIRRQRQFPFMNDSIPPGMSRRFDLPEGHPPIGGHGERMVGLGSGVVVTPDGYILTNYHVVDGAEQIRVTLSDDRTFDVTVVGVDPPSDLALLKADVSGLPVLTFGDSDAVRVGDVALAVGSPLGLPETVTMGIVSAKERTTGLSDGTFQDFLQTDAAINRGNSGGALVNIRGELIGVNSQILSPSGGNIGIGFAIPSNMARAVMQQLAEAGTVRRGSLGVTVQDLTSDLAASMGLDATRGVIVTAVRRSSAAEKAGVMQGDVIRSFNGTPVTDGNQLRNAVAQTAPGTGVTLTLWRDGTERELSATLDQLPEDGERAEPTTRGDGSSGERSALGLRVAPITPEVAAQLGVPSETKGLAVTAVDPLGAAASAGIRPGDIIQKAGGKAVGSVDELRRQMAGAGDKPLLLVVRRDGEIRFQAVRARS